MDLKSRYKNLIEWGRKYSDTTIITLVLIFIFIAGLSIGFLINTGKSNPIVIDKNAKIGLPVQDKLTENFDTVNYDNGNFIASINGKSYYPKDCPSAKRIKEENTIWFNSAKEAEAQGYKPAQNCP